MRATQLVSFGDLGYVQISNFHGPVPEQEDVGGLKISVDHILLVEGFQAVNYLESHLPNVFLVDVFFLHLEFADFLKEVPIVRTLCHDASL